MSRLFLTAPSESMSKALSGKPQSLSCSDITALKIATKKSQSDNANEQRRKLLVKSRAQSRDTFIHRFLRPKSPLVRSMERTKKRTPAHSTPDPVYDRVDDIDQRLVQIRSQLSMFRKQDMDFRERLDSLSNSIDELASRSSLASDISDVTFPSDDAAEEYYYEDDDDQAFENNLTNVSMSFSSEMLNCIASITVTSCTRDDNRHESDPSESILMIHA